MALLLIGARYYINYKANNLLNYLVKELTDNSYRATADNIIIDYFPAGLTLSNISFAPVADTGNYFKGSAKLASLHISSLFGLVAYKKLNVIELELIEPSIESYGVKTEKKSKLGVAETLREINNGLLNTFNQLKVQNALIKDAALRVQTGNDLSDYVYLNHLTIGINGLEIDEAEANRNIGIAAKGRVKVSLSNPEIHIPDSAVKVKLGLLNYSTESNILELDEAKVAYDKPGEKSDSFNLSSIKVSGFDWGKYISDATLAFDTILVDNGAANLNLTSISIFGQKGKAPKEKKPYQGDDILINYLKISDIHYKILTTETIEQRKGVSQFNLIGNNLSASAFSLINGRDPLVDVGNVNIDISEYSDYNAADQFVASLGALSIDKRNLTISDYKIEPLSGSRRSKNNVISVPQFQLVNYSLEDLLNKKLTADKIVVNDPLVVLDVLKQPGKKNKSNSGNPDDLIAKIAPRIASKINIKQIDINNGSLKLQPMSSPTDEVILQGLSLSLDAKKLLASTTTPEALASIIELKSKGFTIGGGKVNLKVANLELIEDGKGLYFGRVFGDIGPAISLDLYGVAVIDRSLSFNIRATDQLTLSNVSVDSGYITINASGNKRQKQEVEKAINEFIAAQLDLKNIVIRYKNDQGLAASSRLNISSENFRFTSKNASWDKLEVSSSSNKMQTEDLQFDAGELVLLQPGYIQFKNTTAHWSKAHTSFGFQTNDMLMRVGVNKTDISKLAIQEITLEKPKIDVRIGEKLSENLRAGNVAAPLPDISLSKLTLNQPSIELHLFDKLNKEVTITRTSPNAITLTNLRTENSDLERTIKAASLSLVKANLNSKLAQRKLQDAFVAIDAENIVYHLNSKQFGALFNNVVLENIDQTFTLKDSSQLHIKATALGIKNFNFSSATQAKPLQMVLNENWWAEGLYLSYPGKSNLNVYNLNLAHNKTIDFSFDSLSYLPKQTREEFWAAQPFQKDFMPVSIGKTSASSINYVYKDSTLESIFIPELFVDDLKLHPQRDKRFPEDTVSYRPLLTKQLQALPINVAIQKLNLSNSMVKYNEIGKKGREGSLYFSAINGTISNIKNHLITGNDSLKLRINAKAQGSGNLNLYFSQSNLDSLQSFDMRTRLGNFNLKEMNSMAEALGARIKSGTIDSLSMHVKGNDLFAYGTMDARFRGLKFKILGKDGGERFFLSGVVDWLANMLIRGKDNGKADLIYKERWRNKGTFNFWGKIFAEGMMTNFGIKRDKAEKKKFKKEIHQYNIPEANWDFVSPLN